MGRSFRLKHTSITIQSYKKKDKTRLHLSGIKVLLDIHIGYALHAGGGWPGYLFNAD